MKWTFEKQLAGEILHKLNHTPLANWPADFRQLLDRLEGKNPLAIALYKKGLPHGKESK